MGAHSRIACLLILLLGPAASAQQPSPPAQAGSNKISVDVVVTRKSSPPVSGLQQQDFTVLDNKAPQTISSFQAVDGRQASIEVIIVVDAVNAEYHTVAYERDQIDRLLRAEGGDLAHATALAVLEDTGVRYIADFSKDGNRVSASLDQYTASLRTVTRSAGFYGATERFQVSLKGLQEVVERVSPDSGRKIMVWISPGWPLLSGPRVGIDAKGQEQLFADAVNFSTALRRGRITLYNVDPLGASEGVGRANYWEDFVKGIRKPSQVLPGNLGLQVLAVQSGGLVLTFNNDITALLRTCLQDTSAYYEISFDPSTGGGPNEYHQLEIRIAQHGLTARTWQGYYSQPELQWPASPVTPIETGGGRVPH